MTAVQFTVAGIPAPQGSKTRTKWGMREDNAATQPWREAVAWEATAAIKRLTREWSNGDGHEPVLQLPFPGPLVVHVNFVFPRPKGHYRTGRNAGLLRPSAPWFMQTKPDVDKLVRALCDAMKGIVYLDDSQVVRVVATKLYGSPSAQVMVQPASPEEVA